MATKTPGAYLLTFRLGKTLSIPIPKKPITLSRGWYCYAGSALGGLEGRLSRHLRTTSPKHWHVDHLLSNAAVMDLQLTEATDRETECRLLELALDTGNAEIVAGFGATDCSCEGHLVRFDQRPGMSIHAALPQSCQNQIMTALHEHYVEHASFERDPFETLVTCILSLRTRDPVTHAASERLFSKVQTPADFVEAELEAISDAISTVGMYRQKAVNLKRIASLLVDDYDGAVPDSIDDLLRLPGVGRKTANLVVSFAFHRSAVCVDTHVHRICNRMGWVRTKTPDETEFELRRLLREENWLPFNPLLVQHGQQVCGPGRPKCEACPLREWCNYPALLREAEIKAAIPKAPAHPSLRILAPSKGTKGDKWLSPFEE